MPYNNLRSLLIVLKKVAKKIYYKARALYQMMKYFIKNTIPVYFSLAFYKKTFIAVLSDNNITNAKPFNIKGWHFKYEYYTGIYNEKKVFIKFNAHGDLINHEYNNYKLLRNGSPFLCEHLPIVYMMGDFRGGKYLVEEFLDVCDVEHYVGNLEDAENIIYQLMKIYRELQKLQFLHLDINSHNVYISTDKKAYLIDLGFSNLNEMNTSIFFNDHFRRLILNNLNKDTRLDVAVIDDAYSMLAVAKKIDPLIISRNYSVWREFVELSGKLVFDGRHLL